MSLTTYVVGGFPRSGSSMMMRALMAAGLEAFYDTGKDRDLSLKWQQRKDSGYDPNPYGVFEPGRYRELPEFPAMIRGKLVKLMGRGPSLAHFAACDPMRIAFILRDPAAIRLSHRKALGRQPVWTTEAGYRQLVRTRLSEFAACHYIRTVTRIRYEDIVDPATRLSQFKALVDDGWEIDPAAAAETVEEALCRSRI